MIISVPGSWACYENYIFINCFVPSLAQTKFLIIYWLILFLLFLWNQWRLWGGAIGTWGEGHLVATCPEMRLWISFWRMQLYFISLAEGNFFFFLIQWEQCSLWVVALVSLSVCTTSTCPQSTDYRQHSMFLSCCCGWRTVVQAWIALISFLFVHCSFCARNMLLLSSSSHTVTLFP